MTKTRSMLLILVACTTVVGAAHATIMNEEWDGDGYNWKEYDDRITRFDAKPFNDTFGTSVPFVVDHKSYDAHFAKEKATKKRIADRDNISPDNHAELAFSGFWQGMNAYSSGAFPTACKKCIDEVKARVKKVVLRYDDRINDYKMSLDKDGTLIFTVASGIRTTSYGWIGEEGPKIFTSWKEYDEAHH